MRRRFKANVCLYRIWFYLYRKWAGLAPVFYESDTKFIIDGFQRSGNTYATYLIEKTFTKIQFVHHLHAVAPLKIAIKKGLPVFILIREPEESISSYYLKYFSLRNSELPDPIDSILLRELVVDWNDFYTYCIENIDQVNVIQFEKLIRDPMKFLFEIADKLEITLATKVIHDKINENISSFRGARDILGSSIPSSYKENLKFYVKEHLYGLKEFDLATNTFKKMQDV